MFHAIINIAKIIFFSLLGLVSFYTSAQEIQIKVFDRMYDSDSLVMPQNLLDSLQEDIEIGLVLSDSASILFKASCWRGMNPIIDSKNKIEVRFYNLSKHVGADGPVIILSYHNTWEVKGLNVSFGDVEQLEMNTTISLDSIFSELVKNNIFGLPNWSELIHGKELYNPGSDKFIKVQSFISDRLCYCLEYKVGNRFRRYAYCNPEDFAQLPRPNHNRLDFVRITELFGELVK